MKAYLFNDTIGGHVGSRGVMQSLSVRINEAGGSVICSSMCGNKKIDQHMFEVCNTVIVNGEGTIHDDNPCSTFLLETLMRGVEQNKKTFLINTVFQNQSRGTECLEHLDYCSVREPFSLYHIQKYRTKPTDLVADSVIDPIVWRFGSQRTDYKGATILGNFWYDKYDILKNSINFPVHSLHLESWKQSFGDLVATLKTAGLYITGQHHGVYAAGLAGIPFVAIKSNTHKIESLLYWFNLEWNLTIPVVSTEKTFLEALEFAQNKQNKYIFLEFKKFLLTRNFTKF